MDERVRSGSVCLVGALLCGCSSSESIALGSADTPEARDSEPGSQSPQQPGNAPDPEPREEAPAEVEVESTFRAPVVTGRRIWAANPQSGRVALVDALSHEVQTLAAGLQPTYLTAIGGQSANRALVINQGSSDATLFREEGPGLAQLDIPLHQGATAWSVSASGRWAIAWSDEREYAALDPTEGLQDITLIDLIEQQPAAQRFSVGYRPVQVTIDAAEARAYAVTRDGISVLALGEAPALEEDIFLSDDEGDFTGGGAQPVLSDVPITADGRFAVVRYAGAAELAVVSLEENRRSVVELPAEVSDVDLVGGGPTAVAVMRASGQVAIFDVAQAFGDPAAVTVESFTGEDFGSVALPEAGGKALLYTNAVANDRLTIVDMQQGPSRTVSLKAPISAVFPSPEGSHAIALLETEEESDRQGAFSIVPVAESLPPKIQGTEAPPFRVTIAETQAGLMGLIATRSDADGIFAVYLVRMPSLQVDRIELSSPPLSVGLLPEHGVGFVAQEHPEGRITFLDLSTAEPQTLTGFELAGRVVGGGDR